MTRPRKNRKIFRPPLIMGFRPFGSSGEAAESVTLLYEEFESIRLADYEALTQQEAAQHMDISTPTFSRIYDVARQKFAKAMVEGLALNIQGGNIAFDELWYKCNQCQTTYSPAEKTEPENCPVCRSIDFLKIISGVNISKAELLPRPVVHYTGFCICQRCGLRISHQAAIPCRSLICPSCGIAMIRENHPVK